MKFGIHYSLGVGVHPAADDYIRIAQQAETLGYNSVRTCRPERKYHLSFLSFWKEFPSIFCK